VPSSGKIRSVLKRIRSPREKKTGRSNIGQFQRRSCRSCIQKWHDIGKGRALNEEETELVVGLVMGWIEGQIGEGKF